MARAVEPTPEASTSAPKGQPGVVLAPSPDPAASRMAEPPRSDEPPATDVAPMDSELTPAEQAAAVWGPRPSSEDADLEEVEADDEGPAGGTAPFDLQPPAPESGRSNATVAQIPGQPHRPLVWGRNWISVALIAGPNAVGLGAEFIRFVTPYVGVGIEAQDVVVLGRGGYNLFELTPRMVLLALPRRRVTPIATAGFGASFFNRGGGVYAHWIGGPGFLFAIRERASFGFGVELEGYLPTARFERTFECGVIPNRCSLSLAPWIRFGYRF